MAIHLVIRKGVRALCVCLLAAVSAVWPLAAQAGSVSDTMKSMGNALQASAGERALLHLATIINSTCKVIR